MIKNSDASTEDVLSASKAREIVSEINSFGVNQLQIKKIIKLLSLELVDRNLMTGIIDLIDDSFKESKTKVKIEI